MRNLQLTAIKSNLPGIQISHIAFIDHETHTLKYSYTLYDIFIDIFYQKFQLTLR